MKKKVVTYKGSNPLKDKEAGDLDKLRNLAKKMGYDQVLVFIGKSEVPGQPTAMQVLRRMSCNMEFVLASIASLIHFSTTEGGRTVDLDNDQVIEELTALVKRRRPGFLKRLLS